jgi:hypothetical protein
MENKGNQEPTPLSKRKFAASFVKDTSLKFTTKQQSELAERQRQIFEAEFPELFDGSSDELASFKRDLEDGLVIPPKLPHQTLTRKKKKI